MIRGMSWVLLSVLLPGSVLAQDSAGVLVQLTNQNQVVVTACIPGRLDLPKDVRALLVWADRGTDRWRLFTGPWDMRTDLVPTQGRIDALPLFDQSRGKTGLVEGAALLTTPLDQLTTQVVVRGWRLSTPEDGVVLLSGYPTFRRVAPKTDKLPATTMTLLGGAKELAKITLAEGQLSLKWADVIGLSPDLRKAGLPSGDYTLEVDAELGKQTVRFSVAPQRRAEVLHHADEIARLAGKPGQILAALTAVEQLLSGGLRLGRGRADLGLALDLVDAIPDTEQGPYLKGLRERIVGQLQGNRSPAFWLPGLDATGILELDEARQQILLARWDNALQRLDRLTADGKGDRRRQGLVELYRGVVFSEAGPGRDEEATTAFDRALSLLASGRPEDLYRAHNNLAGFRLGRCQDRLYNHAFQLATGVPQPVLSALRDWMAARDHYTHALKLAENLQPDHHLAVELNLARLHALLADILRTLAAPDESQSFREAISAAETQARQFALGVTKAKDGGELIAGVAEEVLAHLAFRQADTKVARDHAKRAERLYVRAGTLAGVEGVHRLLGLCDRFDSRGLQDVARRKACESALNHLLIAHHLGEVLRQRYPSDRTGMSQAGFFSRRAYLNELLVELLIEEGKAEDALRFAELGKARALQDALAAQRTNAPHEPIDLAAVLRRWPKDVVAVEYFLGGQSAWVFCVAAGGKVSAHELRDAKGQPVASRDLVRRVQGLLSGFDHQAVKMRGRLLSGQGFDHSWQDELHRFYQELLPAAVVGEMRSASEVVVVPHHVLHYFPFAALVTKPDARTRGGNKMVQPRFLLDEPFAVSTTPSLATWASLRARLAGPIRQANAIGIVAVPGAVPLEGVKQELAVLRDAFGDRVGSVVEDEQGTRGNARKLLSKPGLLLLATHGLNVPSRPLESHLMLQPTAGDDGLLRARDVYAMDVESDVVVLNACYSGLADQSPMPGDDLFGLQRALLHSGAGSVVAGMWDVYDGTSPQLMGGFLRQLALGESPARALKLAQGDFVNACRATEDDPWLHPYFWAVYGVAGR